MKKNVLVILLSLMILCLPNVVQAASANIRVSSNTSSAVVGSTITATVTVSSSSALGSWEFLVSYNTNYLKLVSSNLENGSNRSTGYVSNGNTKSKTYTLKFQVLKGGNATIGIGSNLVYGYDESEMSVSTTSKTIKILTKAEVEASYSKNNYLKSLKVGEYELSPVFSKDTLEYSVTVPSTVNSINIETVKEDGSASVSGDGEKEVEEGINSFDIKVVAQNGDERVYKLVVNVEDKNPIKIKIDGQDYTVVKNAKNIVKPELYEQTTIKINDFDIPAFVNDVTKFTLVALKDKNGKIFLAIYDDKEKDYQLYMEEKSNNLTLYLMTPTEDLNGYIKSTIELNGFNYDCFKVKEDSDFSIIYAMNIETGEVGYFVYNSKENSFQKYFDEKVILLQEEQDKYKMVIMIFAGVSTFFLILCMFLLLRKPNKKLLKKIEVLENIQNVNVEQMEQKKEKKSDDKKVKKNKKKKQEKEDVSDLKEESKKTEEEYEPEKAMQKMLDVEKVIENYKKTMSLSKDELKKAQNLEEKEDKSEETMYDLFAEDKKSKKKKKK